VIANDTNAGAPTVKVADAFAAPRLAVTMVLPTVAPVDNPEASMLATEGTEELQLTALVRFWTLPSV
jgi:hypothetical protein